MPVSTQLPARAAHPDARRRLLRSRRAGALSRAPAALPQPALGRAGRARRARRRRSGSGTSRRFEPLPGQPAAAAGAALPRAPVPHLQPAARRRPRLPATRSCATPRRPAARPRHQGQRPDAVVARRRRAADAEGRRARGARDRDAGGARRLHLEDASACSRPASSCARRRAVADALVGAGAARPLAHALRQLPAPRLPRRRRRASRRCSTTPSRHYYPTLVDGARRRAGVAFLARGRRRSARLARAWMAAGFVHGVLNTDNMNITGESFDYGPWRFLPTYDPASPPPISTTRASTPSAASPTSVQWNLEQLAEALSQLVARSTRSPRRSRLSRRRLARRVDRGGCSRRLGLGSARPRRRRALAARRVSSFLAESQVGSTASSSTGTAARRAPRARSPARRPVTTPAPRFDAAAAAV